MVAFASPASARDAPRTEEGQLIEWMELGSCWRVVPYAAKKSDKQQDEMKDKNRKKVIKTKLKFSKSKNRWVVIERWEEAKLR